MPAGDAGLDLTRNGQRFGPRQMDPLMAAGWNMRQTEIDRLQAQLATQQAVVDAAREAMTCIDADDPALWLHFAGGGCLDLLDRALDAQAAQPEGEQPR